MSGANKSAEKRRHPANRGVKLSLLTENPPSIFLLNELYADYSISEESEIENKGRFPAS